MIQMLFQNLWAKVANGHSPFPPKINNFASFFRLTRPISFFFLCLFLPTQIGLHFWPTWSIVSGQRVDYLSPTLYATDLFIIFLFVTTLLQRTLSVSRKGVVCMGLVLGVLTIGIVFSLSPFVGWYGLVKTVEFLFVGWYVATHMSQVLAFLKITFPIGIAGESMLTLWQFLLQHSVGGFWYLLGERTFSGDTPGIANVSLQGSLVLRPYATFPHPNVLAGYLLIGLLFVFLLRKEYSLFWQRILVGIGVLGSIALVLTLSRTGILLGVGIASIFFIKTIVKSSRKTQLLIGGIGIVLFSLLGIMLLPRFTGINLVGESFILREQLLQAGWQMVVTHPLFGVGINNFIVNLPLVAPRLPLQPVHNIYLLVLSETGIGGFLIFVYLLVQAVKRMLSYIFESRFKKNMGIFTLFSIFIFLSVGCVDHYFLTLQQGQLLTAFIFGLSLAAQKN